MQAGIWVYDNDGMEIELPAISPEAGPCITVRWGSDGVYWIDWGDTE